MWRAGCLDGRMSDDRSRAATDEALLDELRRLLAARGKLSASLIEASDITRATNTYIRRFGSLVAAYGRIGYNLSERQRATSERFSEARWTPTSEQLTRSGLTRSSPSRHEQIFCGQARLVTRQRDFRTPARNHVLACSGGRSLRVPARTTSFGRSQQNTLPATPRRNENAAHLAVSGASLSRKAARRKLAGGLCGLASRESHARKSGTGVAQRSADRTAESGRSGEDAAADDGQQEDVFGRGGARLVAQESRDLVHV
jgi:hypothetical protein